MDSNFPFLIRRYSTFRNDLSFFVWQRYFIKASSSPVVIRSRSKCRMKSICVSQQRVLKVLLLMWSSPAALVKVKLSASRLSTGPQSFFSHALYHFRMISSLVILGPVNTGALAAPRRPTTPPASVQTPRYKQIPARHCSPFHRSFSYSALVVVAFFGSMPVS